MYDLMIIGAGPAGLAASVYAARKRLNVVLISGDIGGQVNRNTGVENYLGYQFIEGAELVEKFNSQVRQFPIEQKIGFNVSRLKKTKKGFEVVTEEGEKFQASTAILATGKRPRQLNVPGETTFAGKGVTYCSICDGPLFSGQRVAVVGGGNAALESALDMVKIAKHVDVVSLTRLTGDTILVERLKEAKNVSFFTEYQVEEIEGEVFVEGMKIKDLKNAKSKLLKVKGVFVEIGMVPNSEPVKGLVELNKLGEVPIDCSCQTSVLGLYAAGDVTSAPEKQIIVAAGEGAKAALQAHRYLQRLAG